MRGDIKSYRYAEVLPLIKIGFKSVKTVVVHTNPKIKTARSAHSRCCLCASCINICLLYLKYDDFIIFRYHPGGCRDCTLLFIQYVQKQGTEGKESTAKTWLTGSSPARCSHLNYALQFIY